MTDAIRVVEDSGERERGNANEWGFWQHTPAVWKMHSDMIQWNAPESEQRRVARAHVAYLAKRLEAAGVKATPYMIALAYGAGLSAAVGNSASPEKRDYANRAANIYNDTI